AKPLAVPYQTVPGPVDFRLDGRYGGVKFLWVTLNKALFFILLAWGTSDSFLAWIFYKFGRRSAALVGEEV
ncbi:MAG TPA: hypothetical protein DHW22_09440, partial [Planctomycetaceae bacterium]|nr:hypothetical protein [Planctomycetaceae bacterium]